MDVGTFSHGFGETSIKGIIYPMSKKNTFNYAANATSTFKLDSVEIVFIIQEVISLCFNVPLLFYIINDKKTRRAKHNRFFMNLLLVHVALSTAAVIATFYLPSISAIINGGFFMEMFLSLVICSFDRYINIKLPYKYAKLTSTKILFIAAGSWGISTIFVVISTILRITPYQMTVVFTSLILLSGIILTSSNVHIYLIAKRHAKAILTNNTAAADVRKEKKVLKATYVCFALVASFIMLWLPLLLHGVLVMVNMYTPAKEKMFTKIVFNIGCLNSIIDPILYVCFRKELRKNFQRIFQRKGHKPTADTRGSSQTTPDSPQMLKATQDHSVSVISDTVL